MKATKQLRRKELAAAISMLLVLPASALAQDQEQDSNISMEDDLITEEVIVTGIRRGLMNSIDIKGTSNSIVVSPTASPSTLTSRDTLSILSGPSSITPPVPSSSRRLADG